MKIALLITAIFLGVTACGPQDPNPPRPPANIPPPVSGNSTPAPMAQPKTCPGTVKTCPSGQQAIVDPATCEQICP
jgi:hypothetical protein